jgi:hypothetical protein
MRFGKDRNVCATLKGTTLLYVIFVDTKTTKPWTGFDIRSSIDSLKMSTEWLKKQGEENDATLNFKLEYFHNKTSYTIPKDLPKKSLYESINTITDKNGWKKINSWSDYISKKALVAFPETTRFYKLLNSGTNTKKTPKPGDTEKLIVALKEKYKTDNIVLCFMLNNYYKNDISLTLNKMSLETPEYFINSYKSPVLITQQILNLFGAQNYYKLAKDEKTRPKNDELIAKDFPTEIMLLQDRANLDNLSISPVTQYMLGWRDDVEKKYEKVFKRNLKEEF